MNAEGAIPVHIDSKRWKAPRLPSSCLPSRGRRNVGGLKPLSVRKDREGGWYGGKRERRYGQPPALHGNSDGHSSSVFETALTTTRCSERERGRDCDTPFRTQNSLRRLRCAETAPRKRDSGV